MRVQVGRTKANITLKVVLGKALYFTGVSDELHFTEGHARRLTGTISARYRQKQTATTT